MRNSNRVLIVAAAMAVATFAFTLIRSLDRHPVGNRKVPEPAKRVELDRYLGRWYEIARYEQRFERGCKAATANYSLRDDGNIDVVNRCRKCGGNQSEARGIAKVVDRRSNAKLKVSFFGPFYGDYWILDHADDYSWSIVGEPSGRYLWILSREANPGNHEVAKLITLVTALGYDTSMLVMDNR